MVAVVTADTRSFEKIINNVIKYSEGFIEGANRAKPVFLANLGQGVIQALYQYIDSSARLNREALHHVYEWYRTGSPSARLFDLDYNIFGSNLYINSSFKQSESISNGSSTPFYNKARIMEEGVPVSIKPKKNLLVFDVNGETVFTSKEVSVENPGGPMVEGSYQKVFNEFMTRYFTQSFLKASGIFEYISNPDIYKKTIRAGSKNGKATGISSGYKWISEAKAGIE